MSRQETYQVFARMTQEDRKPPLRLNPDKTSKPYSKWKPKEPEEKDRRAGNE